MPVATTDNVARPRAFGYGVSLSGRLFRLAIARNRPMQIVSAPLEAPRVNTTSSAEEAAAEFGLTFARSQFDGGEGLFRAHTEGAAPNRFWDSKGVSVNVAEPGEFPEIRLLHSVANVEAVGTGARMAYDTIGGALYVCDGAVLRRTTDLTSWADDDPDAGEAGVTQVHDVAVLGDVVYAALGANGIHRRVSGVWSSWNDVAATRVWAVKGRIVASDGDSLYEVTTSGAAPTALAILPSGETWTTVADGGNVVLAGASDGYVYAFTTDTGSLVLQSQTLFESEQVTALGQSQGIVGICTSQGNVGRFYAATCADNGQLVNQQLIRQWGTQDGATAQHGHRVLGTRNALYAGVTDGTDTHLWRYDLVTGGISRNLGVDGVTGAVRGIESVDGYLVFSVDGAGVYVEQDTFVDEGWLIGPLGDFYSSQAKSWVSAFYETGEVVDGQSVSLHYTSNPEDLNDASSTGWHRVDLRTGGSGQSDLLSLDPAVVSRYLAGKVTLTPSSLADSTPTVRSFGFGAYPSSGDEDWIVTFPVNVSDQIERRGRRRVRVKGRGETEYAALLGIAGRPVTAQFFKPARTMRGLVEEVGVPQLAESRRGSPLLVAQVRIRGRWVSTGTTTGAGTFSTFHLFGTTPTYGEMA